MILQSLLQEIQYDITAGNLEEDISDIVYDSRKVGPHSLFVCLKGHFTDGHTYAEQAYAKGCRNFLVCDDIAIHDDSNIVRVADTRVVLGIISATFFGHPEKELKLIGITGTKGKTTTSFMIKSILEEAGYRVGLIGTNGVYIQDYYEKLVNTTPESFDLYRLMRMMADRRCTYLVMEVSSIGLKADRVNGLFFDYAVYTNLSPDHIGKNEHADFEEYRYWKTVLFQRCRKSILNLDDQNVSFMAIGDHPIYYGAGEHADYRLLDTKQTMKNHSAGCSFAFLHDFVTYEMEISMPGTYNVYNALAAAAVAFEESVPASLIKKALAEVSVKGRMENVETGLDFSVIIDYAHNALSFEKVYETISMYPHNRIIGVFGSVGDKAQNRRYGMGKIAGEKFDFSVVTEDHTVTEPASEVCAQIIQGILDADGRYIEIDDRGEAIRYAIQHAKKGDIILLLGYGHETYTLRLNQRIPFDEREVVKNCCRMLYQRPQKTAASASM